MSATQPVTDIRGITPQKHPQIWRIWVEGGESRARGSNKGRNQRRGSLADLPNQWEGKGSRATHELTWEAVVDRSVLQSSSTPHRDSWGWLAQKQVVEGLFSWAAERSPCTQPLSFQGTCYLLGVCPAELPRAEMLQLLIAGRKYCWEASLPPPPRPGLPVSELCCLLWLG